MSEQARQLDALLKNPKLTALGRWELIDKALAEREAQVRAEEQEAARGLVEALERLDEHGWPSSSEGVAAHRQCLTRLNNIWRQALATYNDNRKG